MELPVYTAVGMCHAFMLTVGRIGMELPVYTAVGICHVFMLTGCWQDRDGTPCIYSSWYMSCVYVEWPLAGSGRNSLYIQQLVCVMRLCRLAVGRIGMELPVYTAVCICHAFMLTGCWQDRDGTPRIYSSWYMSCVYVDWLLAESCQKPVNINA